MMYQYDDLRQLSLEFCQGLQEESQELQEERDDERTEEYWQGYENGKKEGIEEGVRQERKAAKKRYAAKEKQMKSYRQKKKVDFFLTAGFFGAWVIVVSKIYRWCASVSDVFRYGYIAVAGAILLFVLNMVYREWKTSDNRPKDESCIISIGKTITGCWRIVRANYILFTLLIFSLVIFAGLFFIELNISPRVKAAVGAFFESSQEEEKSGTGNDVSNSADGETNGQANSDVGQADAEDQNSDISQGKQEEGGRESLEEVSGILPMKNIIITSKEKDEMIDLEDDIRNRVFFLEGKYAVKDWINQDEINETVEMWVKNEIGNGFTNVFDALAPMEVRNATDALSEWEKEANYFWEVRSINNERIDIYREYSKWSLANMISNGYQRMALVLFYNSGQKQSILSYYGNSLLWDFECLGYGDGNSGFIRDRLNQIMMRYQDIAYTCGGCEEAAYAERLKTAFEVLKLKY